MTERRTALVTGAASGIGLETVRRFSQDSKYTVFAADRNAAVHTIFDAAEHSNVVSLQVDVRDREQIASMLGRVFSESGRLDVIVNAAGVMHKGKARDYKDDTENFNPDLVEMKETNLYAPILIMVGAAKYMKAKGGVIINVTSSKRYFPDLYHAEYQSGKDTLSKVTRGLARDKDGFIRESNIRLVEVQPGNTKTSIDLNGKWTEGIDRNEVEAVQLISNWWRKTFGNNPKNVAEVIYKIAEADTNKTTVLVGLDAKLGRALYLLSFSIGFYRSHHLFLVGSTLVYQVARLIEGLKEKNQNK